LNLNGVAVGVVDTVDAEFLVELCPEGRVASIEGLHQSASLLEVNAKAAPTPKSN
jgi:uncharacterized protein YggU (UPF0235/DUF167 family)